MASHEHARTREVVARQTAGAYVLHGRGGREWLACEEPIDLAEAR